MSVLSGQSIKKANIMKPFDERTELNGMTYGVGAASYDCRIDLGPNCVSKKMTIRAGRCALAATKEKFKMPNNVCGFVKDKSTYARLHISVFNTFIDPGWEGYLTLEIANHSEKAITLIDGDPICQIVFMRLDEKAEKPYKGKYQNQRRGAVSAK
jgi:dCTP deaminase